MPFELQAFLGIIHYLNEFSPSTTGICESLIQLTSSKTEWSWNVTYQKLLDNAKPIITEDVCMKFYDETQPLYLERDASGIWLRADLLQTRTLYKLPKTQSSRQQHIHTHCICKQELVKCRKKIQQHWKRGTRYITWAQEAPSLPLCQRGQYNNRSQTASSILQEICSNATYCIDNTMNFSQNMQVQSKNQIYS